MKTIPSRPTRLQTLGLILLVVAIEIGRAANLARSGAVGGVAHNERRWHTWSYRRSDLPSLFARVRSCLREGDTVAVMVPHGQHHGWWQVMTLYYLPDHRLAGVYDIDDRTARAAARVFIRRHGGFHVARPAAPC